MLRNKQNWFEFNVAFSSKMSMGKGIFIILCNWFVKGEIFFVSDLILWSEPNCFYIINQLPIPDCLSDSLLFLFFRLFRLSFSFRILACFLYFNIFSRFFLFIFCFCRTSFLSLISFYINIFFIKILIWYLFISVYIIVIVFFVNLLCDIFADPKINWVIDELRISFHELFDLVCFNIFDCIFLQMKNNFCSSLQSVTSWIFCYLKLSISCRNPNMLLRLFWCFWNNNNLICNEESGVKSNSKLSN